MAGSERMADAERVPRRRRTRLADRAVVVLGVVLAVLAVTAALVAPHEPAGPRFDGAEVHVWVTSDADGAIGRVNTLLGEFDAARALDTSEVDLAQAGSSVLVIDRRIGSVVALDPATLEFGEAVWLPSRDAQVLIVPEPVNERDAGEPVGAATDTGPTVALLAPRTGRLWLTSVGELSSFSRSSPPAFAFGAGAGLTRDAGGGVLVAAPREGAVYRIGAAGDSERVGGFAPFRGSGSEPVQVAEGAEGWAVLDPIASRLLLPGRVVDLGGRAGAAAGLALEQTTPSAGEGGSSSVADASGMLVATAEELLVVGGDGNVRSLARAGDGEPARPVRVGECVFSAWGDGGTWSRCGGAPDAEAGAGIRIRPAAPAAPAPLVATTAAMVRLGPTEAPGGPLATAAGGSPDTAPAPVFRTNGRAIVLNDPASGEVWRVTGEGAAPIGWGGLLGDRGESEALAAGGPDAPGADAPSDERPDATPPNADARRADPPDPGDGSRASQPPPRPAVDPPAVDPSADGPVGGTPGDPEPGEPGAPLRPSRIQAVADPASGTISVSWSAFDGGAGPVLGYFAQRLAPGEHPADCRVDPGGAVVPPGGEVRSVGASRSAVFGGAAPPAGGYRLVVWGYTAAECVASAAVTVLPEPAPGPVVETAGRMVWVGTRYEYRIEPVGGAPRYEVQRLDAERRPVSDAIPFAGAAVPRELTGGPFGEAVLLRLRACTLWGAEASCGPWSEDAAPEPSLNFTFPGLAYAPERGEWTWDALPDNGGLEVRYVCTSRSLTEGQSSTTDTSCTTENSVPADDAILAVRVSGRSYDFSGAKP